MAKKPYGTFECPTCGEMTYIGCRHIQFVHNRPGMSMSEHAVALGKLGGSAKSDAKTKAARLNAKKGGWPKGRKRTPKKKAGE